MPGRKKKPSWDSEHPPRPRLIERLQWEDAYIKRSLGPPPKFDYEFDPLDSALGKESDWYEYDRAKKAWEQQRVELSKVAIRESAKLIDQGRM